MGLLDKAKAAAGSVVSMAGDLLGAGLDKVKDAIDEVILASPHLREVGYRLTDVELRIALSPSVILHLIQEQIVSAETFQAVLANNSAYKTFCTVVNLLQKVNALQQRIQPAQRKFEDLEIELGLPPVLRLRYVEDPSPAAPAANALTAAPPNSENP